MSEIAASQITLRKAIGIIAMVFPFALILSTLTAGFTPMLESLSASYWSNAGSLFIGMLVTFGIFLTAYKGYDKRDQWITTISGISMLGVAFFPMFVGRTDYLLMFISPEITGILHNVFAGIAFSLLGVMSFFQFTQNFGEMTKNKKKRNLIYRVCGITIFAAILLMIPAKLILATNVIRLFFWLESIVVIAFGVSWFIKSESLLKD